MSITYNLDIPAAANSPSVDQPLMTVNTNAVSQWTDVDHYRFLESTAGKHRQVTFAGKNTPGGQTDPASVLYTASGTASTVADLRFVNQNGTFPINSLRVMGSFITVTPTGAITPSTSFNVTSITASLPSNTYTVVVPSTVLTGTNIAVFISIDNHTSGTLEPTWTYDDPTKSLVISGVYSSGRRVSFQIYQV